MIRRRRRRSDRGFSLLEVLVSMAIVGFAVVALQSALGGAVDKAMATKVNRQLRHLAQFQYGQVVIGKLHPDEEDPFLDGQTGAFEDVGGYPEEYERFGWELRVDEVSVVGASNLDLEEAGFTPDDSGQYSRPMTDDLVQATKEGGAGGLGALFAGEGQRPEGQFRRRITLTLRWTAASAEDDRTYTLVTLVPVEEESSMPGAGLPGGAGAEGGVGPGAGAGAAQGGTAGGFSGGVPIGGERR